MSNYRLLTTLIAPFVPLWLHWRKRHGKEDPARMGERFGIASQPRPAGTLLWLHAASVGEANSVLLLIQKIHERYPDIKLLLTTGTVTSAQLMQARLPKDAIHQYVPVDTPKAVDRFIWHWRPDLAFWVESEFWPNLVMAANDYGSFMSVINGRMSEHSFKSWKKRISLIRQMLSCFNLLLAQSGKDADRLEQLGAKDVLCVGNLKYDAALLPCDEGELVRLKKTVGARPAWLAASTHPDEELLVAQTHDLLAATRANLLTFIVPRHPERGPAIAAELRKHWRVSLRSQQEPISADTQIYIADTLGELGLFYRLCEIAFMGGSLVRHGGQNPLEPARLSCAVITGPHTYNFADIYEDMAEAGGVLRASSVSELAAHVDRLLNNPAARDTMQTTVRKWVESKNGTAARVMDILEPVFAPKSVIVPKPNLEKALSEAKGES